MVMDNNTNEERWRKLAEEIAKNRAENQERIQERKNPTIEKWDLMSDELQVQWLKNLVNL